MMKISQRFGRKNTSREQRSDEESQPHDFGVSKPEQTMLFLEPGEKINNVVMADGSEGVPLWPAKLGYR